jgi:hypothetical protein
MVDPAAPAVHPPGTTFDIEFWVDSAVHGSNERIWSIALNVQFTDTLMEPSDTIDPFSEINGNFSTTQSNDYDAVEKTLLLRLGNAIPVSPDDGAPTGGDILIAKVNFTSLNVGVSTLNYINLGEPSPNTTRYSLASAAATPLTPTADSLDVALPVQLSAFTVASTDKDVVVKWQTESELNNLGFDVYRSESLDGTFVKVNQTRIQGAGTDANPHSYKFIDESVEVGKTYYYYIEDISYSGVRNRSNIIQVIVDATGKLKVIGLAPSKFALLQNYPNPFNPETWIPYQLSRNASVAVRIYNLKGQLIRTLALGQKTAGTYLVKDRAVYWNGRDDVGEKVTSGVYFYTLQAGEFMATRRMVIIK